jgi:hypothetical protein
MAARHWQRHLRPLLCMRYRIGICGGAYSEELTAAWEEWDRGNGSENDHPQIFQDDQVPLASECKAALLKLGKNAEPEKDAFL